MPSNTVTLQGTINWATFFLGNRLLAITANEPAITSANLVIQAMMLPPFRWRWNRTVTSAIPITSANQDYVAALSDFGFIEKAYVVDGSGVTYEIPDIKQELAKDQGTGRPSAIAPYLDDNAGNITFRLMPGKSDQNYNLFVVYQKQPVLLTTLTGATGTWPIPDRYGSVYQQGFLGFMLLFAGDKQGAGFMLQRFTASLLALSEGLTEQERNAFLESWRFTVESQREATKTAQGITARSAS